MYVCMYMSVCVCVSVCLCVFVCMCVYRYLCIGACMFYEGMDESNQPWLEATSWGGASLPHRTNQLGGQASPIGCTALVGSNQLLAAGLVHPVCENVLHVCLWDYLCGLSNSSCAHMQLGAAVVSIMCLRIHMLLMCLV